MNDPHGVEEARIISTRIDREDKWVRSTGRKLHHRWYRWYSERKSKLAFICQLPVVLASAGLLLTNFLFAVRTPYLLGTIAAVFVAPIALLVLGLSSATMVMNISRSVMGEKSLLDGPGPINPLKAGTVLRMRVRGRDAIIGFNYGPDDLNNWCNKNLHLDSCNQAFRITGLSNHVLEGAVVSVVTDADGVRDSKAEQEEIIRIVNETIARELMDPGISPRDTVDSINYTYERLNDLLNRVVEKAALVGVGLDGDVVNHARSLLKKDNSERQDSDVVNRELDHMVTVLSSLDDKLESYSQDAREIRESTAVFEDLSRRIPSPSV
jgi:hypothetical protein